MNELRVPVEPLIDPARVWRRDLGIVLRRYGFWGLDIDEGLGSITPNLQVLNAVWGQMARSPGSFCVIFLDPSEGATVPGIDCQAEPAGHMVYDARRAWLRSPSVKYRPLLPHVSFFGPTITPIWVTQTGRAVLGWWEHDGQRCLLVGLQVVEELVRYTQGDANKVKSCADKTLWGHGHERPAYLYEDHVVPGRELFPWADQLGYELAQLFAKGSRLPLISPLPDGACGAVLLTGDDDQAYLEKYDEQLRFIGDFPISYLLLPNTRHTSATLQQMPTTVEFGIHIDALDDPDRYDAITQEQTQAVSKLIARAPKAVRNHGHLNRGYWGHLSAWESCGLNFDLNIRGMDGTCPTGSYLPFRVRRPDGSWSNHISLFSTFSDSMYYLQKWSERKQIRCIARLANQIGQMFPGIIVFNFHPQNFSDGRRVHEAVMQISRRRGWVALGVETYLEWLETLETLRIEPIGSRPGSFTFSTSREMSGLVVRYPTEKGWQHRKLPTWTGRTEVTFN